MTRSWMFIVATFVCATVLAVPSIASEPKQPIVRHETQTDWKRAPHVAGEVLVRFHSNTTDAQQKAAHAALGARVLRRFHIVENLVLVELPDRMSVEEAMGRYAAMDTVAYAEPNGIHTTLVTPDDPNFSSLWGLHNTGQNGGTPDADINAPEAWEITTGDPTVVIGVIDTGVAYDHPDLAANMWTNSLEIPGNGVDDDGNGYIDDIHGINAINDTGDPMDSAGHGTHCAGTIAGDGNNGTGVAGVNWQAQIVGCNFLGTGSGETADAIKCLEYMFDLKTRATDPVPVVATNNSWGGGGYEQSLSDAIARVGEVDVLFVAAAGNSGSNNDAGPSYPANYELPNLISVAATNRNDSLAGFSNYGASTVHVAAPGVSIQSTYPGGGYASLSGTSMAAPHVTGLAGLIAAQDRSRGVPQLKNLIMLGGEPVGSTSDTTISGNRIRAADSGGRGSLTCADQFLSQQLAPRRDRTLVFRPDGVELSALNVECDQGAGDVDVLVSPGDETLTLLDDGQNGDALAGDGVYTRSYVPADTGVLELSFPTGEVRTAEFFNETYRGPLPASYEWRTITGTALNMGDDTTRTIAVPFDWKFNNGHPSGVSDVLVSSNGQISLTDDNPSAANPMLPTPGMDTVVAALWDDLNPNNGGDVYWEVIGSAPDRELVIEWRDVRHFDCGTDGVSFQIVAQEASPDIFINYRDVSFGDPACDAGATATVGVQVSGQRAALASYATPSLVDGTAYRFSINQMPDIDAGADVVVLPGETVTLAGTASDPDGDDTIQALGWSQLEGIEVTLTDADTLTPQLTAPDENGHLVFELAVSDDGGVTLRDQTRVTVDHPPLADAGADRSVEPGAAVELDGSGSSDPDGTIEGYQWAAIEGTPVTIEDANTARPTVHAEKSGRTVIELTVTDDLGVTATDTMTLEITGDPKGCMCGITSQPQRRARIPAFVLLALGGLAFALRRRVRAA